MCDLQETEPREARGLDVKNKTLGRAKKQDQGGSPWLQSWTLTPFLEPGSVSGPRHPAPRDPRLLHTLAVALGSLAPHPSHSGFPRNTCINYHETSTTSAVAPNRTLSKTPSSLALFHSLEDLILGIFCREII